MGYSIGAGVATYTASQRDVNGLILVSPYDEALMCINEERITILLKWKILDDIYLRSSSSPKSIYHSRIEDFENSMNLIRYIIANFEDFQL